MRNVEGMTVQEQVSEMRRQIENIKKAVLELNYFSDIAPEATDLVFNSGTGCETYPFGESFDELACRVGMWNVGGK